MSSPTRAQIAAVTPSRARSTAVLAAPPPMFNTSSSTVTSSPALGKWSSGGQRWSATTEPGADDRGVRRGRARRARHGGGSHAVVETSMSRQARRSRASLERVVSRSRPRDHDGLSIEATTSSPRSRAPTVSGSSVGRLPIISSISATDRTSRSIRASVRRSSSSRCSSRMR